MKYVKVLGLLAVASAALMAFTASASAATLTSPTGTTYTGTISASGTKPTLDGSFTTVTCLKSTVEGKVEQHGVSATVAGKISKLTFEECNFPVTVIKLGSLELHAINNPVAGQAHSTCSTGNDMCTGTLTSVGAEVTVATSVGTCTFSTGAGTSVGVVTPTGDTGGTGVIDIGSSPIPRTGGNFLCGSSATWTGSYTVNTPHNFWIDH